MTYDEDGQIGRSVIGAVVIKILATVLAAVMHLKVLIQQRSFSTIGTATAPAAQ
jgi:hypothetical protein